MSSVIDSYQFGLISVDGKQYTSDVIVFPDRVKDNWCRRSSHQLLLGDIAEAMAGKPEVLIVGTGAWGVMDVLPEVQQAADAQDIKLIVETTDKACRTYNRLSHSHRAVAALHLTC